MLCLTIFGSLYQLSSTPITTGVPIFIAVIINGTSATAYIGSQERKTITIPVLDSTSYPTSIGWDAPAPYFFNGTMDYVMFGNYELTQAEIAQLYSALMLTGRRNIIDDIIPANAISLGFVRTNSTKVIEKNDSWYKFGRREGAKGGNRKVFLPWKYFSGGGYLKWENPFGTGKYSKEIHWAQDARGTNELPCNSAFYSNTAYGVYPTSANTGYNDAQNITMATLPTGVTNFNGVWKTSGYIGVYIECLEDYKGADAA